MGRDPESNPGSPGSGEIISLRWECHGVLPEEPEEVTGIKGGWVFLIRLETMDGWSQAEIFILGG